MDNKSKTLVTDEYLAHVDYETQRKQTMQEHMENTALFSKEICPLPELQNIVCLIAVLHDLGKLGSENQDDFQKILKYGDHVHKHNLDHSTAGGNIAKKLIKEKTFAELASTVIFSHHGLNDCIEMQTGETLQEHREKKKIEEELILKRLKSIYEWKTLEEKGDAAFQDFKSIYFKIGMFLNKNYDCGEGEFFLGMYMRLLLSILIDSDWTDTTCFFEDKPLEHRYSKEQTQQVWRECNKHFEKYLLKEVQKKNGSVLNQYRHEISELCRSKAGSEHALYRLTVPTGAGKTLSSLRFALGEAVKKEKQHIIYVAPFNSILVQNAEEIRKAVGNPEIVLEHHCNVVCEESEEERYRSLTETWDSPIIVTTAVQMLNTLFSDQKGCIRRLHTLCNSVIIFDEVQAFPIRCMELFNLAVNFLSSFGNTTVVLCSATQPTLAHIEENNVCKCKEMAGDFKEYANAFKRTEIVDATKEYLGGMEISDLCKFVMDHADEYGSVLVIVNTTDCALQLFKQLKQEKMQGYQLFHLSNNMCPENKADVLRKIRKKLKDKDQKLVCISTQVVEAGVNFSFACVIRSKAGLDNVIQAAGRCNRHKELNKTGKVYIIHMSPEAEKLDNLEEIKSAQNALEKVLYNFRENPKDLDGALDSEKAVKEYYKNFYLQLRANATKFSTKSGNTTVVDLLGINESGRKQYERHHDYQELDSKFAQAFRTAGQEFEVISNDYKINIVVPYNEEAKQIIGKLVTDKLELEEKKRELKKAQRYTVGISEKRRNELSNAVKEFCDREILVLSEGYYDVEVGVLDSPKMDVCTI